MFLRVTTRENYTAIAVVSLDMEQQKKSKKEHWLVRETEGPTWSEDGHIKIEKNNIFGKSRCGIAENAWIPLMRGLKPPKLANALKAGLYSPEFYESLANPKRFYRNRRRGGSMFVGDEVWDDQEVKLCY